MNIHSLSSSRKGQSIIEAMVALSILSLGLMGVLTLLTRSLLLQRVTADQAKATYLAAEGVEIAKSIIDHSVYLGLASMGAQGGWEKCFLAGDYDLDFETKACPPFPNLGGNGGLLYFDSGTGLYYNSTDAKKPGTAVATNFSRHITITNVDANEIDVRSTVTWSTATFTNQSITLEDHFYNWHP